MKKKILLGFLILVALIAIPGIKNYKKWNNTSIYSARLRYDGHEVLREIQRLQSDFFKQKNRYASTISELVGNAEKVSRQLQENPDSYPGFAKENARVGSFYFYSIEESSINGFIAQAKFKGFQSFGEDVWQIKQEGEPFPIKTSQYYRKR